ncbi:DUF742 domain-containing protein [Actinocorallia aurantiaca]|jgi:hypothetical protein|uniref:DUF742 domain-containing protein n=1 Tax=Actinocorallia aurantiaca TaxID=46204 RepID=A0ABN3UCQ2_9ACTN
MADRRDPWLDEGVTPVVRPYALTRGRTEPEGEHLHLTSVVQALVEPAEVSSGEPECLLLLTLCRSPAVVVDLASDAGLPLGVTRVLLGDLRHRGMISVSREPSPNAVADLQVIQEVLDGLRSL